MHSHGGQEPKTAKGRRNVKIATVVIAPIAIGIVVAAAVMGGVTL